LAQSVGLGVGALALVACNALLGIEDRSPREADASAGTDAAVDGTLDAAVIDSGALSAYSRLVLRDEPIVYLRLAEKSGAEVAVNEVASEPRLDGLYPPAGMQLGVPGRLGDPTDTAVHVEGVRFIRMADADRLAFEGTHAFTVEAWVRPDDGPEFGYLVDHQTYDGPGGKTGWALIIGSSDVYLERWSKGVNSGSVSSGEPLARAVWHHVVGTYDGTTEDLFIDGVRVGSAHTTDPIPAGVGAGWAVGGQNCGCTMNFVGDLDDVAIYDKGLREAKIKAHFAAARR
jgi:hypothetical protein